MINCRNESLKGGKKERKCTKCTKRYNIFVQTRQCTLFKQMV